MGFLDNMKETFKELSGNKNITSGYKRAYQGDLKDSAFLIYDYREPVITLKVCGHMNRSTGFNEYGLADTTNKIIKDIKPSNMNIQVDFDEMRRLYMQDRIKMRDVVEGEITSEAEEFIRSKVDNNFQTVKVYPECKNRTADDKDLTEKEMLDIENEGISDLVIATNVKRMMNLARNVFNDVTQTCELCLIGKMVEGGRISCYILVSRDNRLFLAAPNEIVSYIRNKLVYRCGVSGTTITGLDGFRIRDTMSINKDNRACYVKEIKKQFGIQK